MAMFVYGTRIKQLALKLLSQKQDQHKPSQPVSWRLILNIYLLLIWMVLVDFMTSIQTCSSHILVIQMRSIVLTFVWRAQTICVVDVLSSWLVVKMVCYVVGTWCLRKWFWIRICAPRPILQKHQLKIENHHSQKCFKTSQTRKEQVRNNNSIASLKWKHNRKRTVWFAVLTILKHAIWLQHQVQHLKVSKFINLPIW